MLPTFAEPHYDVVLAALALPASPATASNPAVLTVDAQQLALVDPYHVTNVVERHSYGCVCGSASFWSAPWRWPASGSPAELF